MRTFVIVVRGSFFYCSEWEVKAGCCDWEAEVAAREAAAQEAAIATPDGRVAYGQSKVFDPSKP